jgi:hypothetical protein
MKTLAALLLAVSFAGCATTPYVPTALHKAPDDAAGAYAYDRACEQMGLAVVGGTCGRWVGYIFVSESVPADAVEKIRRQP